MAVRPLAAAVLAAVVMPLAMTLGACQDSTMLGGASGRGLTPIPPQVLSLMQSKGMQPSDPILIRAYKKEAEMEVWKRGANGQYALLKTYPICRWSGQLGPKTKQGDRQAPEGFYTITPGQMNPNSSYYLSFDVGYPNAVDRAKGGSASGTGPSRSARRSDASKPRRPRRSPRSMPPSPPGRRPRSPAIRSDRISSITAPG